MEKQETHVYLILDDVDNQGIKDKLAQIKEGSFSEEASLGKSCVANYGNRWRLKSTLGLEAEITEHINNILSSIGVIKEELINCLNSYKGKLFIAIYSYEINPGIKIESSLLNELNKLHLDIEFDIYLLSRKSEG